MKLTKTLLITLMICFFALTGCSNDKRVPVSGQITINGEPLSLATVEFIPVDQTALNTRAGANTDKDGAFSIPKSRGLEPGEYVVTVYASISFDTQTKELATTETSLGNMYTKVLTPPEYNDKSTLRFTISAKEKNHFTCDVISKVSRNFDEK